MLKVIKKRREGKTTRLIIESYKTGAILVCFSKQACCYAMKMAEDYGLKIPKPISFCEFLDCGRESKENYLIDELELCIKAYCPSVIGYSDTIEERMD